MSRLGLFIEECLLIGAGVLLDLQDAIHQGLHPHLGRVEASIELLPPRAAPEAPRPVIPVFDYCLRCGTMRGATEADPCARCGQPQLQTMPEECPRGVPS